MIQIDSDPVAQGIPVACTLSATDQARRCRRDHAPLLGAARDAGAARWVCAAFPWDETWAARLLVFIAEERACCPFFTFALVFEPQQGPLWLHQRHG